MELYIARHGQTEFNVQKRWQGHGDSPLTELGRQQAAELGKRIEGIDFDVIYSSPLKRAMDTARIAFGDPELVTDARLKEVGLGDAEGLTLEEVEAKFPGTFEKLGADPEAYFPPTNGEALPAMMARIDSFLEELAAKPYSRVFVLTHGFALRVFHACADDKSLSAIGRSPYVDNCHLSRFVCKGNKWTAL